MRWIVLFAAVASIASAQPTMEFDAPTAAARPGEEYPLVLRVVWEGDAGDVAVMPPEVPALDWGAVALGTTISGGGGGEFYVEHQIKIVPAEPGDFTMPVVTVPYADEQTAASGGAAPAAMPYLLQTESFSIHVRPDRTGLFFAGGVLAIVLIGLAVLLWRRRAARNAVDARLDPRTPHERAQAAMHDARRRRLDGNYYLYYVVLAQSAEILRDAGGDAALAEKLAQQAQAVGFQGVRPTDDDMDGALREMERALAQSKETSLK